MTTRLLPVEDWARLADSDVPVAQLNPATTRILVAEQDGAIVGRVVLLQAWHAEFFEVAPAYRGRVSVIRALRRRLLEEAHTLQAPTLLMAALSKTMNGILCWLGADRLPGDHYVLTIKEPVSCLQR